MRTRNCILLLFTFIDALCFAQEGFIEEFNYPEFEKDWQIWQWEGKPWSYHIPASYSLIEHPGSLHFKLGSMVTNADFPNLYQYWYYPSLHIYRDFSAKNWIMEVKVTYFLPYSNAKHFIFEILYGDIFKRKYAIQICKSLDVVNPRAPSNLEILVLNNGRQQSISVEPDTALYHQRFQTYYILICKVGLEFIIGWKKPGIEFQLAEIITLDEQINWLPQRLQITSKSWFSASGAYADYDFIRLQPIHPRDYLSKKSLAEFLNDKKLFFDYIGSADAEFADKFLDYFPIIAEMKKMSQQCPLEQQKIAVNLSFRDSLKQELARYQQLDRETEKIVPEIFLDFNKANFLSSRKWVYNGLVRLCWQLHNLYPADGYNELAYFYVEKIKSQCMLQLISQNNALDAAFKNAPLRAKESEILENIANLCSEQTKFREDLDKRSRLWQQMDSLYQEWGNIRNSKEMLIYKKKHITHYDILKVADIQKFFLDKDTAILSYYFCFDKIYSFLITRNEFSLIPLGNKRDILRLINLYFDLISQYSNYDGYEKMSKKLFHLLIAPFYAKIKSKKQLVIIADSVLCYFPFESLMISDTTKIKRSEFLGFKYAISYANSVSQLNALRERWKRKNGFVQYDFLGFFNLPELSKNEISSRTSENIIHRYDDLFPVQRRRIFTGKDVNEDMLKRIIENNSTKILHIAAHCQYDENLQWSQKILLSQSDTAEQDDILTLAEAFGLQLRADLVVLAGCKSGNGALYSSEGLFNFGRAFQSAGARSIIGCLWDVENFSTTLFMKFFYQNLTSGKKTKAESMKYARKSLYLYENGRFSHPFYWAPFVLFGDFQ